MIPFRLGQIVSTPGALEALEAAGQTPLEFLGRHQMNDWGDMCKADKKQNDDALKVADPNLTNRLMSAYTLRNGTKIWIITEWDRSVTTILLPEEY